MNPAHPPTLQAYHDAIDDLKSSFARDFYAGHPTRFTIFHTMHHYADRFSPDDLDTIRFRTEMNHAFRTNAPNSAQCQKEQLKSYDVACDLTAEVAKAHILKSSPAEDLLRDIHDIRNIALDEGTSSLTALYCLDRLSAIFGHVSGATAPKGNNKSRALQEVVITATRDIASRHDHNVVKTEADLIGTDMTMGVMRQTSAASRKILGEMSAIITPPPRRSPQR